MDFKASIEQLHASLGELEDAARKLPNQNAADLIKSARGRIAQLVDHPDLEAVGEQVKAADYGYHDGQDTCPFHDHNPLGPTEPQPGSPFHDHNPLGPTEPQPGSPFDPKAGA